MAILSDLAKETSFRRFYRRWLAASWLPVLGVIVLWASAWLPGFPWPYVGMYLVTPLELWFLVGLGQWFFMRRYSLHAGRWAVAAFLGGTIATFVWMVAANVKMKMAGVWFVLAVGVAQTLAVPHDSFVAATIGAAVSGPIGALLPALFLVKDWRDRRAWLILSGMTGIVAYAALLPLQHRLHDLSPEMIITDSALVPGYTLMAMILMMPTYLLAAWLFSSAVMGVFIWNLRERQALRDNGHLPRVFD